MKTIISYILIFAIITLFALYLDATSGFFVMIIFISAIVISSVLHIYALKRFDCTLAANAELVERGDEIKLTVRVSRAGFFVPTAFEIKLDLSEHLECSDTAYVVTLGRKEKEQVFILKAVYWGKASIGIESVRAVDILGILKGRLKSKTAQDLIKIKVFPAVPDLSQKAELVQTLNDASAYDDNEQSREVPFAMVGFPGYEHRDYVPGDPLKSINWKLSAKRDRLLVRKPEAYAGGDQVLILSKLAGTERVHEQIAIESMLALIRTLIKQEILCRVYVCYDSEWKVLEVVGEVELESLRYDLIEYSFVEEDNVLPDLTGEIASGFLTFTAEPAVTLLNETISDKWHIQLSDGEVIFTRG